MMAPASSARVVRLPNDGPAPDRYALSEARRRHVETRVDRYKITYAPPVRRSRSVVADALILAIGRLGETPAELAAAIGFDKSTVNERAAILEARGLVTRTRIRCGKTYQHALALTAEGEKLARELSGEREAA